MLSTVAVVIALATSCGGQQDAAPTDLVEGLQVRVSAIDNLFRPEQLEVRAGTEVVWNNDGRNVHDVVPADGGGWGVALADFEPGAAYRHRFVRPGTYRYYCTIHGTAERGMIGSVTVTAD